MISRFCEPLLDDFRFERKGIPEFSQRKVTKDFSKKMNIYRSLTNRLQSNADNSYPDDPDYGFSL